MSSFWKPDIKGVCGQFYTRAINKEEAVTRIDQIIDRQLSKANGILAFNGLLLAGLGASTLPWKGAVWPIILASLSSGLLLWMFRVRWSAPANYKDPEVEVADAVIVLEERTHHLTIALIASSLSLFAYLGLVIYAALGK